MPQAAPPLKKTPLYEPFRRLGARLVDFAGWELPVQFSSVLQEHAAVRSAAGLFDVSHMGEIEIRGAGSLRLVQSLTPNDAAALPPGRAQYSALTTERGTFVDDILVYRRAADDFLLVVNAANTDRDFAWIAARASGDVEVVNASTRYAQLALQGPRAVSILQDLADARVAALRPFEFVETGVGGARALVSRTGYTGEDGFEIYLAPDATSGLWEKLLEAGRGRGLLPCGLGARDTLRLEARLPLYGNDIDDTTTILEAGLGFIIRFEKGEFLGRTALLREREAGPGRRLAGVSMLDPGIPRHGYPVSTPSGATGVITSGGYAPSLKKSIALAYLPSAEAREGTQLFVDLRGRRARAAVVPTPFYRRPR